jgi:type II secretory pathway pseudopilin PulG
MRNNSRRPALTLVEVVLVLALLVVISAVTVPLITGSLTQARLVHSADLVRAAWGKARLAAMRAGESYVFRYEPQGSRYQIVRLAATMAEDAGDINLLPPEEAADVEYEEVDLLRLSLSRLPEEVVFASGEIGAVPQLAASVAATEGGWSSPILFYADGTTTDAAITLANSTGAMIRVTLRGLTGISRTSEIGSEATR